MILTNVKNVLFDRLHNYYSSACFCVGIHLTRLTLRYLPNQWDSNFVLTPFICDIHLIYIPGSECHDVSVLNFDFFPWPELWSWHLLAISWYNSSYSSELSMNIMNFFSAFTMDILKFCLFWAEQNEKNATIWNLAKKLVRHFQKLIRQNHEGINKGIRISHIDIHILKEFMYWYSHSQFNGSLLLFITSFS